MREEEAEGRVRLEGDAWLWLWLEKIYNFGSRISTLNVNELKTDKTHLTSSSA